MSQPPSTPPLNYLPPAAPPAAPRPVSVRLPFGKPFMTYVFLGLITLVFLGQLASGQLLGEDLVLDYGAKVNSLIAQGEYWRLLTAIFVHASILHFGFNAYALYILGRDVEAFNGPVRFSLVFLLAGLSGSLFSLVFNPSPSVGASGAIFGLIGALVVFLYRHRKLFGERGRRNLQSIVVIALINLAIGLRGGIDNWAHLGGLVGGLILGWAIGPVWALRQETLLGSQPVVEDTRPLGPVQWLVALGFLMVMLLIVLAWTMLR
ncbi:MAG: rhomboid family intramembrane serine protease [Anaerolineales bacterium]